MFKRQHAEGPSTTSGHTSSEELRTAEAVMMKNMQAMQDGSTP
jgi:hypothetical protein